MTTINESHHHDQPHMTLKTYFVIYAALMGLMTLTLVAAFFDLGAANFPLAMGIAFAKMVMIILYFMHVKFNDGLTKVFSCAALLWFMIFVVLTLNDYFTRGVFGVSGK